MTTRFTTHAAALCRRAANAKPITIGRVQVYGPVTEEDRVINDAMGEERLTRVTVALVPTASFASFTRHVAVDVDGDAFTLRDHRRIDDGEITELFLASAT